MVVRINMDQKGDAERYLNVVRSIILALDITGKITFLNRKGYEILGYEEGTLVGKDWFNSCLPKEIQDEVRIAFENWVKGKSKTLEHHENAIITRLGEKRLISWYNTEVREENGQLIGTLSSGEDITERKKTEEALRYSEEKHRKMFEESMDAILVADVATGIIVECNAAASKLFDRQKSELVGKHQSIFAPPKQMDGEFARVFKQHLKDQSSILETQIIRKTGEIRDVAIKSSIFELNGKKLMQGMFRDITERKKNDRILKVNEEKFRNLSENSPNMIFIYQKGKVVYVNEEAEKIMGYTKEEYYSSKFNFLDLILPENRELVVSSFVKHEKGKDISPYEYCLVTKSRRKIDVILNTKIITYNEEPAILGIVTDITERKLIQHALRESEEKFRTITNSIRTPLSWLIMKQKWYLGIQLPKKLLATQK